MAVKVKCMNEKCNNYKQELNEGVEVCSLCNEPVTKFETKEKGKLSIAAIIISLVGFSFFFWGFTWVMAILGMAAVPLSVVLAFISKSKAAVIVTILSLIASFAAFMAFFIMA